MRHLVLIISLWLASPAWGAIVFDAATSMGGTSSTSGTATIAADADLALVCVSERDTNASGFTANASATVGGAAATLLTSAQTANNTVRVNLFYKLTPATGSVTVSVTSDTGSDLTLTGVATYKGVAQSSTFNSSGSSISDSGSSNVDIDGLASAVGEMVVLCGGVRTSTSLPSPDATSPVSTERIDDVFTSSLSQRGFFYDEAGASPTVDIRVDLSLSETWAAVGVSIRAAATTGIRRRGTIWFP